MAITLAEEFAIREKYALRMIEDLESVASGGGMVWYSPWSNLRDSAIAQRQMLNDLRIRAETAGFRNVSAACLALMQSMESAWNRAVAYRMDAADGEITGEDGTVLGISDPADWPGLAEPREGLAGALLDVLTGPRRPGGEGEIPWVWIAGALAAVVVVGVLLR
jgi:hypothetical protein